VLKQKQTSRVSPFRIISRLSKISKIPAVLLFIPILLGTGFATAGIGRQMPQRSPVVLGPQESCTDQWTCYDSAAVAAVWDAVAQGRRPLRIASYNVHKCTGMDFKRDLDRIAEVIRSLDADIISLQEVLSDQGEVTSGQVRYLAEKTGMYMAIANPTKRKKDGLFGNALLSRFPITEVRLHDISLGTFEPRGVIDADIMVGNLTVRVIATHLGLLPMERYHQVDRLLEILPNKFESPLIVMGDMNGWIPGSPELRRLQKRLGKPITMASYPASLPLLPLERIWILPSEHMSKAETKLSELTRLASDHLPLVASVYLHGKSSTATYVGPSD
jgi:endonuclease/exonuclease/phosphatase family metal-dependent hydrolase